MYHGFYTELAELTRDDPLADFGFLENEVVTQHQNALQFLHGYCADFAAILSEVYGYKIEALRHCDEDGFTGKLIHAYCVAQIQGERAYIDVRGITTDPELFSNEFANEMTYYPEEGTLWDLEGQVSVEHWDSKDTLFNGEYEGWTDDEIRNFILDLDQYYNAERFAKKLSLNKQIGQASAKQLEPSPIIKKAPER